MSTSIDQQFVEFIAKSLVSQPDAVQVERRIDERGVLLELTVAPEDLGRVIGKHGATAQSLRTLLRALGTKNDARYNLKIVDSDQPEGQQNNAAAPRVSDEHQDEQPVPAASTWSNDNTDDNSGDDDNNNSAEETSEPVDHQSENEEPSEEQQSGEPAHNSMVDKTRKELAELDDLDV